MVKGSHILFTSAWLGYVARLIPRLSFETRAAFGVINYRLWIHESGFSDSAV
jgi:hypothetical protein